MIKIHPQPLLPDPDNPRRTGARGNGVVREQLRAPLAIYATLLLTLINIFNYIDRMILAVLVQPIKKDLQLTDTQIGLLSGFAFVAMYAAIGLPLARLADRVGRRWVLAGSVTVWSLMSAACGATHSFAQLALARLGVGVGEAGCMPSSHALIAEIYPQGRRAVPISIVTAGAAVGIALGLSIGGLVAANYGWRAAFIIVGLPGVLLAVLVALTLPEPPRAQIRIAPQLPLWATVRALYGIRTYRWITFTHPFYTFVTAGVITWLPAFFMRSHGMKVQQVGTFFGIAYGFGIGGGGFLGAYTLQALTWKAPERSLYLAGWLTLIAFPFYVGALLISSTWVSLTLMMFFGALIGGAGSPMIAGQQGVVDDKTRALASALSMLFASYLGAGLGPLLLGMGSEMLTPSLGANALRAVLLIASIAIILPGLFLIQASRSFAADATS